MVKPARQSQPLGQQQCSWGFPEHCCGFCRSDPAAKPLGGRESLCVISDSMFDDVWGIYGYLNQTHLDIETPWRTLLFLYRQTSCHRLERPNRPELLTPLLLYLRTSLDPHCFFMGFRHRHCRLSHATKSTSIDQSTQGGQNCSCWMQRHVGSAPPQMLCEA